GGAAPPVIQRAHAPASGAPSPSACTQTPPSFKFGTRVIFGQDKDQPLPGQDGLITKMIAQANAASAVELHGNASSEGDSDYNPDLSCRRAGTVAARLSAGGVRATPTLFAHGATTVYGKAGNVDYNRNVVLVVKSPPPPQKEEPPPKKDDEDAK